MRNHVAAVGLASAIFLLGGCATTPEPTPTKVAAKPQAPAKPVAAAPAAPAAPVKPAAPAPTEFKAPTVALEAPNLPPPKLSPEAAALIDRLTSASGDSEILPHEVAETTSFQGALESLQPGAKAPSVSGSEEVGNQPPVKGLTADGNTTALIERDWTGLVLVPIAKSLSKAYTSDVRLVKVEAHPLNDGRVRVWTRVHNIGNTPLPAEIACEFRMRGSKLVSPYFYQFEVQGNGYRDIFFVSPDGELNAYTVLVRASEVVRR